MPEKMGQLSPRITLEAINEIRARDTGLIEKYGSEDAWEKSFQSVEGALLPSLEDTYSPFANSMHVLRTITFIKTDEEKKIGIGDDYSLGEIPFGTCYVKNFWSYPGEIEFF